jgi:hypothetical protein
MHLRCPLTWDLKMKMVVKWRQMVAVGKGDDRAMGEVYANSLGGFERNRH